MKILLLIILPIIFFAGFINIWPNTSGIVINSVTGEPIKGIAVEQRLGATSPFGLEETKHYKHFITYTDKNGEYSFHNRIKMKFFWLFEFEEETILVNHPTDSADVKPMAINDKYFFYSDYCSVEKSFYGKCNYSIFSKNYKKNHLAPQVTQRAECKNDMLCLEFNARYLALDADDPQICNALNDSPTYNSDIYYGMFNKPKDYCYYTYAIAKRKQGECALITHEKTKEDCSFFVNKIDLCELVGTWHIEALPDKRLITHCADLAI